jgi:predicted metal-dependent hydrolase
MEDPRYREGFRLYREGRYWDSHEAWEELWREATGPPRHLLQALIQLDAALIHTRRGHWGGVANLLARALAHLDHCPDRLWGLDVSALRAALHRYRAAILALKEGRLRQFDWSLAPRLEPLLGPDGSDGQE